MSDQPEAELIVKFLEEQTILDHFHAIKKHGHGRLELVIVDGKLEAINHTVTDKRRDFLAKGRYPS